MIVCALVLDSFLAAGLEHRSSSDHPGFEGLNDPLFAPPFILRDGSFVVPHPRQNREGTWTVVRGDHQ